jgi:hypothetical protein
LTEQPGPAAGDVTERWLRDGNRVMTVPRRGRT